MDMNVPGTRKPTKVNGRKQDAPVSQLPNEILIEIFLEANSEPLSVSRVKTYLTGYCNMAVVISHVCQQWRVLSLGMPTLWTTFYYVAYLSNTTRKIRQRLDAYLERSATRLLDIWIDFRGSRPNLVQRNQTLMTNALCHIQRWRSFTFFPDDSFPVLNFFGQLKNLAAPNLETLFTSAIIPEESRPILTLQNAGGLAANPSLPLIFEKGAPKLSILRMDLTGFHFYLPSLSNVTTFYVHNEDVIRRYFRTQLLSGPLHSAVHLTNLTLDGAFFNHRYNYVGTAHAIVIPKLMHLRLCNQPIHRARFPHFKLPLLETITFYKIQYEEGGGLYPPFDAPNLHSLFLVDSNITDNGVSLTRLTSNITTIVLSDSRTRSAGIRPMELLDYDHAQQGWPMLQDITVNLRNIGKFGLEFYLRCFQARPQIPSITLRIDPSLLVDWQTRFASRLALLENLCTIETLDASNPNIPSPWPINTHGEAFRSLFKKLDPPLIKRYSEYYSLMDL